MPSKIHSCFDNYADLTAGFCLFDDLFMNICFDNDPVFTEQILRIIMNNNDLRVLEARAQVDLKNLIGHSLRLDVLATDSKGRAINIEVQGATGDASAKRARFHSSLLDTILLEKNHPFSELPVCFVIFIAEHDVLKGNLPVYHVDRVVKETSRDFNDGSHIIYVNGENRDDTPLGKLMHDFFCTKSEKIYYNSVAEKIKYYKETEEGQRDMGSTIQKIFADGFAAGQKEMGSTIQKIFADGVAEGRAEGEANGVNKTIKAIGLLQAGKYAIEDIASISGLSLEEVKALQASLS